jgi:hypothetical protein
MIGNCKVCSKEFKYFPSQSKGKYCSLACQGELRAKEALDHFKEKFNEGIDIGRPRQYQILKELHGNQCSVCSLSGTDWQGKPIRLQVDHKDGNAENNDKENLRLICPNCHSQTDTFAGGNRGNGRWNKGLKEKALKGLDTSNGHPYSHGTYRKGRKNLC